MNRTITQLIILARTFADELESIVSQSVSDTPAETTEKPKRTRGPNKEKAAPEPEKEPEKEKAPDEAKGMPIEALQELIKPAVGAAAGAEVKKLIVKHGGTKLADIPAGNHAAFAADIEAMVY